MVNMDDTQKMLVTIINGQSAMKADLLDRLDKLDQKFDQKFDTLDSKFDKVEEKLMKRLDKIGSQLAYLEDDAPTKEEFDELEKRVGRLETQMV